MSYKRTLLIDFDGTLATYTGWKGPDVLGSPLEKARHAMHILDREFRLVCFTTRDKQAVEGWLSAQGFPQMKVTNFKEPAFLILDDRCISFQGQWTEELLNQVRNFRPWWDVPADETDTTPEP